MLGIQVAVRTSVSERNLCVAICITYRYHHCKSPQRPPRLHRASCQVQFSVKELSLDEFPTLPARDVATPSVVAFLLIHDGLLNLVELLWQHPRFVVTPTSEPNCRACDRFALLVSQSNSPNILVTFKRSSDFQHSHIIVLCTFVCWCWLKRKDFN